MTKFIEILNEQLSVKVIMIIYDSEKIAVVGVLKLILSMIPSCEQ